jgi:poly(A) polymerase
LSKADAAKIAIVRSKAGETTPPHALGYRYGFATAVQCVLLRWASLLQPFDASVLPDIVTGAEAKFPVIAADLMPDYQGKALGDRLRALEIAWIESGFLMSKVDVLALP